MTMLRRRRKGGPKPEHVPHGPGPRSRRRARPDAPVPAELLVPPEVVAEVTAPPAPKAARKPERPAKEKAPAEPPPRAAKRARGMQQVVLVTGFEPFGGESSNPSWEVCRRLPREIAGLRVEVCRVPCEFRSAIEVVATAIEEQRPAIVLCLGQAGGRTHVSVERVALNVDDARMADNAGAAPVDEAIAANGPPAYFATVPVKAMVAAMRAAGTPAELSNTAGTYVCNHLMYGVLHFLAASGNAARAGFVHVPYAEEQVLERPGTPSMSIATMARGIEAAIAAAREHATDIAASEGRID